MAMKKAALEYAALGFPVFPCKPRDKTPAVKGWQTAATTNPDTISTWWDSCPSYNIGLSTAGLVVVDCDVNREKGKDGEARLAQWETETGRNLPVTAMAQTGGGGKHYIYRCSAGEVFRNSVDLFGDGSGVDVRGTGGYIVLPPSVHPTGGLYKWIRHPAIFGVAPVDDNVRALLGLSGERGTGADGYTAPLQIPESIEEGSRNRTIFRLACSLVSKGLTDDAIMAAVMAENAARCNPPLDNAELETIVASALRYPHGTSSYTDAASAWVTAQEDFASIVSADATAPVGPFKPEDFSDAGNAAVFAKSFKGNLIFVDALGWLYWNGQRWERDDHRDVAFAVWLSGQMLHEAQESYRIALHERADAQAKYEATGDEADGKTVENTDKVAKEAKAYVTWAGKSRDANKIRHMTELAKPALVLKADELDAEPFDLNTPGGIVDLRTGQIRPHDKIAYCSRITEATPGNEGAEIWAAFLDTITCGDVSTQHFLQQVAGMAAIGKVYQEGIVIAYGGGRNGKSTFFSALSAVMGDYSGSIDVGVLTVDRSSKGASLATLRGKRLVVTGELEEHQRLSVATLKKVAATDGLTVEEKYKQPETIKQSHSLVLFTNHLPRVGSTDAGTWRRLTVVPFNAVIPEGTGVQNYADVLAKKAGGAILSWVIAGAVMFTRNGFKLDIPPAVAEATAAYKQRENWLENFISERCIREPGARVRAQELYNEYRDWAAASGDYMRRASEFNDALENAGFQKIRPKNKATWIGLRVDIGAKFGNPCAATV